MNQKEQLFVIRSPWEGDYQGDWVFADPASGLPIAGAEMDENSFNHPPLLLIKAAAEVVLAQFHAKQPSLNWQMELAAHPCPSCGRKLWMNDGDFCYPQRRDGGVWRAGCNMHDFGCGFEAVGKSRDEALEAWNNAKMFDYPDDSFVSAEGMHRVDAVNALKVVEGAPLFSEEERFIPFVRKIAEDKSNKLTYVAQHYLNMMERRKSA